MNETAISGEGTDTPAASRWELFPVAIGQYLHHPALNAQDEVTRVAGLLTPFGVSMVPWTPAESRQLRGADAVERRLAQLGGQHATNNTILYWVGHGYSDGNQAVLAHALSGSDPLDGSGIEPSRLAERLAERERMDDASVAIVVIDACESARFIEELSASVLGDEDGPRRLLLVGVSGNKPRLGNFSRVLRAVLEVAFAAQETIDLWEFASELTFGLYEGRVVLLDGVRDTAIHRAPVPRLIAALDVAAEIKAVLAQLSDDERQHFIPKARGAEIPRARNAEFGEFAFFFEGRHAETARITSWLSGHRHGLLAVTGAAGTGKSALLGHVLVHSRPELRGILIRHGLLEPLPPHERPVSGVFDAVLHLTGASIIDVVRRLSEAAGLTPPPATQPVHEQIGLLLSRLERRLKPMTLLVDALDEARDPLVIARQILRPLVASSAGIRVVVGTRASTREDPDRTSDDHQDILDALGATARSTIVVQPDQAAVTRYVRRRLHAEIEDGRFAAAHPDLTVDDQSIAAVSSAVGARNGEFLYARLAVPEILARPRLLTADGATLVDDVLPADHRSLFALAVTRLRRLSPAYGALLEALAMSQGRGMPARDGIWAEAAQALCDGAPVSYVDIDAFTDDVAAPYVMIDTDHGQSVFRLAQRAFAEYFPRAPGQPPASVAGGEFDDRHLRIARRLTRHAETLLPAPLNPYLASHLADHVAAAGPAAWQELADHPAVLNALDPGAVAAAGLRALSRHPLPPEILGVIGASHRLAAAPPGQRQGLWQLAVARHGGIVVPPSGDNASDADWTVRWARVTGQPVHLTIPAHKGTVWALAGIPTPDGQTLLASIGTDGPVRMWDPITGTPAGDPMTADAPPERTKGILAFDDRTIIIFEGEPRSAPTADTRLVYIVEHVGGLNTIAVASTHDGQKLLVGACSDGKVHVWDPVSCAPVGGPLATQAGEVWTLAGFRTPDGRSLLALAGADGVVRIWDLMNREEVRRLDAAPADRTYETPSPAASDIAGIRALTVFPAPDGRPLLAAGGEHCSVRIWDPMTGTPFGEPLYGHAGRVQAIAAFRSPAGRTMLATGSLDATIRLWDPLAGTSVGKPLTGHESGVFALATVPAPHGWVLLVSASADGTARLWDPATGSPHGEPLTTHVPGSSVWSLAALPHRTGQLRLATAGSGGQIRIWSLPEGGSRSSTRNVRGIRAVSALHLRDSSQLLGAVDDTGKIHVWDSVSASAIADTALPAAAVPSRDNSRWITMVTLPADDGRTLLAIGTGSEVWLFDPAAGDFVGDPLPVTASAGVQIGFARPSELRRTRANPERARTGHTGRVRVLGGLTAAGGPALLVTGGQDGTVRLWDPRAARSVTVLEGHAKMVYAMAAWPGSGGSTILATGGYDGFIRVWEPMSGVQLRSFAAIPPYDGFGSLAGNPNGVRTLTLLSPLHGPKLLAANGEGGSVRLWDPETGTMTRELVGHAQAVEATAAYSAPDGRCLLATGSKDGTVRIWDPADGSQLAKADVDTAVKALTRISGDLAVVTGEGVIVITPHLRHH